MSGDGGNRGDAGAADDFAVECRQVWKLFGRDAVAARAAVERDRLAPEELVRRFNCILAVADASFGVRRGEIFCIMGLSGSGKSTLVRHINRLIDPTSGAILVNGRRVDKMGAAELRRLRNEMIGMVFQHVALLPHRTVRDNVGFALEIRGEDRRRRRRIVDQRLEQVRLAGWGDRYPDELSGGMQQRVGLARALAADPDILLMDEPFSALDPLIRRHLQDEFLDLSRQLNKTTIFITHDLEEAIKLGSRIAIMRDGRLVQIGRPEEIVSRPADDYVTDFVRGLSRLKLLRAEHVMRPVNGAEIALAPGALAARPDTSLEQLIEMMIRSAAPVRVAEESGRPLGIVTVDALLGAVRGTDVERTA